MKPVYWIVQLCFLAECLSAAEKADNLGKEFIIGFMHNIKYGSNPEKDMKLYISTPKYSVINVRVRAPMYGNLDEQYNVTRGFIQEVIIDKSYRVVGTTLSSQGILITADEEISIVGINDQVYSTDGFLGLPTNVLGMEYYTISSFPTELEAQLMIVGIYDETQVKIDLPSNGNADEISYNGQTYIPGSTLHETIHRYSTFQIQGLGDLSGAHVTSNKAVAVFSGNKKTGVGPSGSDDHLTEQLTSVNTWGQSFATVPMPLRTRGDYFKFVTSGNNTNVTFTCNNSQNISIYNVVLQTAGDFAQMSTTSDEYCHVLASKPILLVQLVLSRIQTEPHTDPAMVLVPPINQYSSDIAFITPKTAIGISYTNHLLFVVESAIKQGLTIDGESLPHEITCINIPDTAYCGGYIPLSDGSHTIEHESSETAFGGIAYGSTDRASYAFPIGMGMARINEECNETLTEFGDGIDNDCDGLIDEEFCTGEFEGYDEDNDGNCDEDCALPWPVNGNWSNWSIWGSCECTCEYASNYSGYRKRERNCTNPSPAFGGDFCSGEGIEFDPVECITKQDCLKRREDNEDGSYFRKSMYYENVLTNTNTDVLWSLTTINLIRCGILCLRDPCCQSYFYHSKERKCYGYKHLVLINSTLEEYPGMKYFTISA